MPLPPGRARGFETAGKQGCDCVAWSRKRRTGFISRQGVYESLRPSSHAVLRDKMSRTCGHTHEKADGFFSQNWNGREAILGLSRLDCLLAKAGGTVNGGAVCAVHLDRWLARLALLFPRQTGSYNVIAVSIPTPLTKKSVKVSAILSASSPPKLPSSTRYKPRPSFPFP